MYCNTVEKSLKNTPMNNGMPWPSSQDVLTVLQDVWPSAAHQLLFNDLLEVTASSVRNWQDGIQQCHQTDFRGKTNCQGIDYKILAQCHLEHPNGDPHERPPDPRRLYKELDPTGYSTGKSAGVWNTTATSSSKSTRRFATPAFSGIRM